MYIVLEIQTNADGTVSPLPPIIKASREEKVITFWRKKK